MNKSSMGAGSSLIVLVFAVLCLSIFTLITFTSARNDLALALAEKHLVTGYYEADTLAEQMAAQGMASFTCPISDKMELFVEIRDCKVLSWYMRDTEAWSAEDSISVWQGVETEENLNVLTDGGASLWGGK